MIAQLLQQQLVSLQQLLIKLAAEQYQYRSAMLDSNSIGQHVRHVAEMIQCLLNGYEENIVDYDARKRDIRIETDGAFAFRLLQYFSEVLQRPDKTLTLQQSMCSEVVHTTYYRELHYNTEHAIHHMALIKVALREMNINIVDENFGVASATIRYKKEQTCAQ